MRERIVPSSFESRREARRSQRRQREKNALLFSILGLFVLMLVLELGRVVRHMQKANLFMATLSTSPSEEVTRELDRIAGDLTDYDPLVRNTAVGAFAVATGRPMSGGIAGLRQWWTENKSTWRYSQRVPTNTPDVISIHPYAPALPQRR